MNSHSTPSGFRKALLMLMVTVLVTFTTSFTTDVPNPFTGKWKVVGYIHRGHPTLLTVEREFVVYDFVTDSTGTISRNDTITSTFSWSKRKKRVTIDDHAGTHVYKFAAWDDNLELLDVGAGYDERGRRYTPQSWAIKFVRF